MLDRANKIDDHLPKTHDRAREMLDRANKIDDHLLKMHGRADKTDSHPWYSDVMMNPFFAGDSPSVENRREALVLTWPSPAFIVRDVPVYGDLILSPMAGFSDVPYRQICREYGSAMSYTEFASVEGILGKTRRSRRILAFSPAERPVVFQIVGAQEDRIVAACQQVEEWGPDIIDINLGCSTPKVSGRGAGAGLLCDPAKIGRVFAKLSHTLRVPVTAKIRLGWDDCSRNHLQVAHILEDNGASLIAVHGRTRAQNYAHPADWDAIAEVKQAVKLPVIGNGDVKCVADMERIKRETGCDGVMIARAAMGNPWIFQRRDWEQITFPEKAAMIRRHLAAMVNFYGQEIGVILFRKHIVRYVRGLPDVTPIRMRLLTCETAAEVLQALDELEARDGLERSG